MKNPPLVTIYIPTHNRCVLLERAVKSVLKQTYSNIELIIVDDASNDGTSDYLKALAVKHENITTYRQNIAKGACAARNIAIANAKGQLISGLDDDDEFLPSRIKQLVSQYDPNFSLICTGFRWHYGSTYRVVDASSKIISLSEQLNYNYCTNQVMVETERLKAINGFDEDFVACQDYDTWTRLIAKFGNAKRIAGSSYVIHRGDEVNRITEPKNWLIGHQQFEQKHSNNFSKNNRLNQEFRRMIAKRQRMTLFNLCLQLKAGLIQQKIRYFLSSNFSNLAKLRHFLLKNK